LNPSTVNPHPRKPDTKHQTPSSKRHTTIFYPRRAGSFSWQTFPCRPVRVTSYVMVSRVTLPGWSFILDLINLESVPAGSRRCWDSVFLWCTFFVSVGETFLSHTFPPGDFRQLALSLSVCLSVCLSIYLSLSLQPQGLVPPLPLASCRGCVCQLDQPRLVKDSQSDFTREG
jgi:hypothetical protein